MKHRGEKTVQTSACSSSGLDEMVRIVKAGEMEGSSKNLLNRLIWAERDGKGVACAACLDWDDVEHTQMSCWSSSGPVGDVGKSRILLTQIISQNGNQKTAWAALGGLGSPNLGS